MSRSLSLLSFAAFHSSFGNSRIGFNRMSLSKVFEPRAFRAQFAHYWSAWLRENYRGPEEVSVAFGVRYQTALNWWQGVNKPSGDSVAMAGRKFTDFIESKK